MAWRTAARMREGVMEEAAGRHEEPPQPPRCDDAMLQRDFALMRKHGQGRRSLPADGTGLPLGLFPEACPYTLDEVESGTWWPDGA